MEEFNSILASPLRFLRLLDHLIRPYQHVRWDRQADLLGCFEIDDEFKLGRLLHGKIGGLGAFEDFVYKRAARRYKSVTLTP
jgi:hypothetical protein